jgi:DNA-binding transcriptional ArsR family regulator
VERLLAALAHRDRLSIIVWLIEHGPARQVEILEYLAARRGSTLNPGVATILLKPLFEAGVVSRERPRGPIAIRDRERLVQLLQVASAMTVEYASTSREDADEDFEKLRRALLQAVPEADAGS